MKANNAPVITAGLIFGKITLKNTPYGVDPKFIAANSRFRSRLFKLARIVTNTSGNAKRV